MGTWDPLPQPGRTECRVGQVLFGGKSEEAPRGGGGGRGQIQTITGAVAYRLTRSIVVIVVRLTEVYGKV